MKEKIFEFEELKNLSEQELKACLEDSWNIKNGQFEVWGEIKPLKDTAWGYLTNPRTISDNKLLTYPLKGISRICEFFISPNDAKKFGDRDSSRFIRCKLELSPRSEREKHNIPFEMNVFSGTCSLLEELPEEVPHEILSHNEKTFFISKSIYEFYHYQADEKINKEFEELKMKQFQELSEARDIAEKQLDVIQNEHSSYENKRDAAIKVYQTLVSNEQKLNETIKSLESQEQRKQERIAQLTAQFFQLETEMNHKITRLKNYVSDKASFLKTFEFLDEEDLECELRAK
ncbi:MAG: hypothetical protein WCL34_10060 [Methylococcaceae bacterium]